jgi:hypothetical protein
LILLILTDNYDHQLLANDVHEYCFRHVQSKLGIKLFNTDDKPAGGIMVLSRSRNSMMIANHLRCTFDVKVIPRSTSQLGFRKALLRCLHKNPDNVILAGGGRFVEAETILRDSRVTYYRLGAE